MVTKNKLNQVETLLIVVYSKFKYKHLLADFQSTLRQITSSFQTI